MRGVQAQNDTFWVVFKKSHGSCGGTQSTGEQTRDRESGPKPECNRQQEAGTRWGHCSPRTGLHWELLAGEAPARHSGHPWELSCNHGRGGRVTTSRGQSRAMVPLRRSTAAVGAARSDTSRPSAAAPCSAPPAARRLPKGAFPGAAPRGSSSRGDSS